MATINDLLEYGRRTLEEGGNEYAKYERKALLEHVLNVNYMYMLMNGDEGIHDDKVLWSFRYNRNHSIDPTLYNYLLRYLYYYQIIHLPIPLRFRYRF